MTDGAKKVSVIAKEDIRTYITLADVYHRIGKAIYGEEWQDYTVVDITGETPVKVNLAAFLRTDNNLTNQPELRPVRPEEASTLPKETPTPEDMNCHYRIMGLLIKEIESVPYYARPIRGDEIEPPSTKHWDDENHQLSPLLSQLVRRDGAAWHLLFSPAGVKKLLAFYNRISGANKNPRGGMKQRLPWTDIDALLIKLYNSPTPPRSYAVCTKQIEEYIHTEAPRLQTQGVSIHDLCPSESAVKKAVARLRDEGRIPDNNR